MAERRIRVLFNVWADPDNKNSQGLSAREIARRLNPERFISSLFVSWNQDRDPALSSHESIRLLRVPPRLGSLYIARELLWGHHDIVFYSALNPRASRLFRLGRRFGRSRRVIDSVETSLDQIAACGERVQSAILSSLRQADLRTAITPAISRDLESQYQIESLVIPLGVDLSLFQPIDRNTRKPPWKVLYVASILPRKQTHLILQFAKSFRNAQVEFHIIGPSLGHPEYFESLLTQKKNDRLDHVVFHGALNQPEIYEHMKSADIYVLPSRLEGFGKTTLEAAAAGLPAVVFSDYETPAVIHGVTGFQVESDNEMLAAIRRLLEEPALRRQMGQAASDHAQKFSWGPIAKRWENVFTDLARGGDATG